MPILSLFVFQILIKKKNQRLRRDIGCPDEIVVRRRDVQHIQKDHEIRNQEKRHRCGKHPPASSFRKSIGELGRKIKPDDCKIDQDQEIHHRLRLFGNRKSQHPEQNGRRRNKDAPGPKSLIPEKISFPFGSLQKTKAVHHMAQHEKRRAGIGGAISHAEGIHHKKIPNRAEDHRNHALPALFPFEDQKQHDRRQAQKNTDDYFCNSRQHKTLLLQFICIAACFYCFSEIPDIYFFEYLPDHQAGTSAFKSMPSYIPANTEYRPPLSSLRCAKQSEYEAALHTYP